METASSLLDIDPEVFEPLRFNLRYGSGVFPGVPGKRNNCPSFLIGRHKPGGSDDLIDVAPGGFASMRRHSRKKEHKLAPRDIRGEALNGFVDGPVSELQMRRSCSA